MKWLGLDWDEGPYFQSQRLEQHLAAVRRLIESGITGISLNLCVLKEAIKRYFRDGSKFAAHIGYVEEDIPSGTLGGVCKQAFGAGAKQVREGEEMPAGTGLRGSTRDWSRRLKGSPRSKRRIPESTSTRLQSIGP
jgi:hypothetical protein